MLNGRLEPLPHEHTACESGEGVEIERGGRGAAGGCDVGAEVGRHAAARSTPRAGNDIRFRVVVQILDGDADAAPVGLSPAKKLPSGTSVPLPFWTSDLPSRMKTRGPPPGPPPTTRSAKPSPSTSPAATKMPLRSACSKAKKSPKSFGPPFDCELRAVEDGDARPAAEAGRDDEVAVAVAVHVADGWSGAAAEVRVVDAEEVGDLGEAVAVEDADARAAALVGRDDEVGLAVAVDVAGRDVDATGEGRLEGIDRKEHGVRNTVEDFDVRRPAGAGADDQVGDAIAVEIGGGGADAAGK